MIREINTEFDQFSDEEKEILQEVLNRLNDLWVNLDYVLVETKCGNIPIRFSRICLEHIRGLPREL